MPALSEFGNDISGTNAEMLALASSADPGARFFNTTYNSWHVFNGTVWQQSSTHFNTTTGMSAKVGGGQSGATQLTGGINRFDTVTNDHDSCLLQAASGVHVGEQVIVINNGAHILDVYPAGTDAINALGASTQFSIGANKSCIFWCTSTGQWNTNLSA